MLKEFLETYLSSKKSSKRREKKIFRRPKGMLTLYEKQKLNAVSLVTLYSKNMVSG